MKPRALLLLTCCLSASCDSRGPASAAVTTDPATPAGAAGSPFFPLTPGTVWSFVGEADGVPYTEEVAVLEPIGWPAPLDPGFGAVHPVEERRYVGGVLAEVSYEWFTTDPAGDVYRVGEQSWSRRGDAFVEEPDSWFAGKGVGPAPYLPAAPAPGMRVLNELPHGLEVREIAAVGVVVEVPAGVMHGCVEVHENPASVDRDIVLYAPGKGVVAERSSNGYRVLAKIRRR